MAENTAPALVTQRPGLVQRMAARFGVDPAKMMTTLKQTCFRLPVGKDGRQQEVTNEEMMALLVIAEKYNLNPWLREIYAFPDKRRGGIVPIISVDGWIRIVQDRPEFDGAEFQFGHDKDGKLEWIECKMFRKDRTHAFPVREYLRENKRDTDLWGQMPNRMLRHRAWMQAGRLTFGFTGLYDDDDAKMIIEGTVIEVEPAVAAMNEEISGVLANGDAMRAAMDRRGGEPQQQPKTVVVKEISEAETSGVVETSTEHTHALIAAKIAAAELAKDMDGLMEAWDLARAVKDELKRAELDVECRRVKKLLEGV